MKTIFYTTLLLLSFSAFAQINPTINKIGMDISTMPQNSSFNYDSCFKVGKDLGMTQTGMFQTWKAIETSSLVYNMAYFNIANIYYPANNMPLDLTLVPINTNVLEVPSDLTVTPMSSTVMISRFNRLLDTIKAHIPNVTLTSLVIGSEHDVYFGNNTTQWNDYITFYNATMTYAKTLWPGLKVSTELTFNGITTHSTLAQTMNANSDYIGVSYYPLNTNFTVKPVSTIPTDFATLVSLFPSQQLCFYQYGYPSSTLCASSDLQQAQFITQTFQSWDQYHNNIKMIDFTWLHDLDPAQVTYLSTYYNLNDPVFLEYLRTLGVRTWGNKGTDKPALHELRCQAKARGYNSLPISCSFTGMNEITSKAEVSIFPNPSSLFIHIHSDHLITKIVVKDILGNVVLQKTDHNGITELSVSELKTGIYFLTGVCNGNNFSEKIIIAH